MLERWHNMAVDLLKLVLSATSTSTTTLTPSQSGYYYEVTAASATTTTTFVLASTDFRDNTGADVTVDFPAVSSNGYYTVSINGIQQMASASALDTETLTLSFTNAEAFNEHDIIDLQIVDYTPETETQTSME